MQNNFVRLVLKIFILILFLFNSTLYCQKSLTQAQIDSTLKKRWNFYRIRDLYGDYTGEQMIKVIRRCCPDEIDTLVAIGKAKIEDRRWSEAVVWFELVIKNDPEDILSNYFYAICKRETGKNTYPGNRAHEWRLSEKHFHRVIEIDSTFKDVFYQYALLKKYRKRCFKAIQLVHRQLSVSGTADNARIGIFRLYDYMLNNTSSTEAEVWLKSQETTYDIFFLGELYRRTQRFEKADSVFHIILSDPNGFPEQPVYLSLVRLYVQKREFLRAEETYWKAVDSVTDDIGADLLIEDFMYIVNEKEYKLLKSDSRLQLLSEALRVMWLRRNPLPSTLYNHRLIEHYRRILYAEENFRYDGFRHSVYKGDLVDFLQFPQWYYENYKLNDMGLVYIRFGDPDEKAAAFGGIMENKVNYEGIGKGKYPFTVLGYGDKIPQNMSWLYYTRGGVPRMIFHFLIPDEAPPGYWTLVPNVERPEILLKLRDWDQRFHRMIIGSEAERYSLKHEIDVERKHTIDDAFQSDSHTWPKETEAIDMKYSIARFRKSEKKDLIQIAYAIPVTDLIENKAEKDSISFEVGINIFDGRATPCFKSVRNYSIGDISDPRIWDGLFIDEFEFPLVMKSYNISIHSSIPEYNKMNGWRFVYTLEDSARNRLACSTLKMCFDILSIQDSAYRKRGTLKMIPNPSKEFDNVKPLFVYYEIYNLSFNAQGVTEYTINFMLKKKSTTKNFFKKFIGMFGRKDGYQITIEDKQSGTSRTVNDYIHFDMHRLNKGLYELTLLVKDRVSGDEAYTVNHFTLN